MSESINVCNEYIRLVFNEYEDPNFFTKECTLLLRSKNEYIKLESENILRYSVQLYADINKTFSEKLNLHT